METLKIAIKCIECKGVLEKPVALQCGMCVCQRHLLNLANHAYACKSCGDDHHIDEKLIIVNKSLELLIDAQIDKLDLGREYRHAMETRDKLDRLVSDTETFRNDPRYSVNSLVGKLRNQTELLREEHKLKIDQKANKIIAALNCYEFDCGLRLTSNEFTAKLAKFDLDLKRIRENLIDWRKSLDSLESKKLKWETIKRDGEAANTHLINSVVDLKAEMFGEELRNHIRTVAQFEDIVLSYKTKNDMNLRDFDEVIYGLELLNSKILDRHLIEELLKVCKLPSSQKWKLLYRASQHGYTAKDFHSKCDNIPSTLSIIKTTKGYIAGGYAKVPWDQSGSFKSDANAFLFSLVNPGYKPIKLDIKLLDNKSAIFCKSDYGPTFGAGYDILITNNFTLPSSCSSNLGHSYNFLDIFNAKKEEYLFGSKSFSIHDIEIYQIPTQ